jgi:predicted nucleotidyltransferase
VWLQRWLGESYAKLYAKYGRGIFTFREALEALNSEAGRTHLALSYLRKMGVLIDFRRGVPKLYRLLEPRSFMLVASGSLRRPSNIQGEYVQLVFDVARALIRGWGVSSMVVYGSVVRNEAGSFSDLDLLIISDRLEGSISSRIDGLLRVEQEPDVLGELRFLRSQNIHTRLSFYPLRKGEAEKLPPLLLDMAYHAAVVVDDGFMESLLSSLRARLESLGARRVTRQDGSWYWDLGPRAAGLWSS